MIRTFALAALTALSLTLTACSGSSMDPMSGPSALVSPNATLREETSDNIVWGDSQGDRVKVAGAPTLPQAPVPARPGLSKPMDSPEFDVFPDGEEGTFHYEVFIRKTAPSLGIKAVRLDVECYQSFDPRPRTFYVGANEGIGEHDRYDFRETCTVKVTARYVFTDGTTSNAAIKVRSQDKAPVVPDVDDLVVEHDHTPWCSHDPSLTRRG